MKTKICQTRFDDFYIERLEKYPFYERYDEILNAFNANFSAKGISFRTLFARPEANMEKRVVDWYAETESDEPIMALKDLKDSEPDAYQRAHEQKDQIVAMLRKTPIADDTDKQFVNCALSHLDCDYIDDVLFFQGDNIIFGVWGMKMLEGRDPASIITDPAKEHRVHKVNYAVKGNGHIDGQTTIIRRHGRILQGAEDIPTIVPDEHYAFVEWIPEPPHGHKVVADVTFTAVCQRSDGYTIKIDTIGGGSLEGSNTLSVKEGDAIEASALPLPRPDEGYQFERWEPQNPAGVVVTDDMEFIAVFEKAPIVPAIPVPADRNIRFDAGTDGTLEGKALLIKKDGEIVGNDEIPTVKPNKGFNFIGWNVIPENWTVDGDKTFVAQYEQRLPWYKRFWLWLTGLFAGKGCLKWLLWLLLGLLALTLLSFLLRSCGHSAFQDYSGCSRHSGFQDHSGCSRHRDMSLPTPIDDRPWVGDIPDDQRHGIYNPGDPYQRVETPNEYRDILPPEVGVLPPLDSSNIVREPNRPAVVGNLLNILMENDDKSILDFARAFKEQYPEDKYQIVYYDDVVKRLQVQVPPAEKDRLKAEIPDKFAPEYDLYVYDESLFVLEHTPNDPDFANEVKNWYLHTVNAPAAWDITQGSETVTVAVVDNGFNLSHPELKSKAVMPYNVWSHDKNITAQDPDHGTHVAGTAIGCINNGIGLCGIAPKCSFIPVQVADPTGKITMTSILDGILYALYQGADVVNVSLGLQFPDGMNSDIQKDLDENYFKEEARLFIKVMEIADKHNAIVVMAAGNQHILAGVDPTKRPRNFIVVSAIDKNVDAVDIAPFSNYGSYSTVSAPGVQIYNAYGRDGFTYLDGTSMAAPIVAGAVALMKSLNGNLTAEQAICALQNTGVDVNEHIGPLVQIDKALRQVQSGDFGDCHESTPEPMTGDVQLLLSWNDYNDLDLACFDPNGDLVWHKNKVVASGGRLQIDMNVQFGESRTPSENIYWPTGQAPFGTYEVYVTMYKQHESRIPSSPYHLKVIHNGNTEEFDQTISKADGSLLVCTFTLGDTNQSANPQQGNAPSRQGNQTDSRRDELLRQRQVLQRQLEAIDNELKTYN